MGRIMVNNKIGIKENLKVTDMKYGYTYRVTFNDGTTNDVLVCHDGYCILNIKSNERLIMSFDNNAVYVVDDDLIRNIEHVNIEVNITK